MLSNPQPHRISVCTDPPLLLLLLTSFSSLGLVETRTSPPAGSFVSHEISTQSFPKGTGFGFALIFPVSFADSFVLLTVDNKNQLLAVIAVSSCCAAGDFSKFPK